MNARVQRLQYVLAVGGVLLALNALVIAHCITPLVLSAHRGDRVRLDPCRRMALGWNVQLYGSCLDDR